MGQAALKKVYPNQTFERAARAAGAQVQVLWEMPGPKETAVAHLTCLSVNGSPAIVQTYQDDGWDVLTSCNNIDCRATIDDALARCQVPSKIAA